VSGPYRSQVWSKLLIPANGGELQGGTGQNQSWFDVETESCRTTLKKPPWAVNPLGVQTHRLRQGYKIISTLQQLARHSHRRN
jgi:hypothetical protein